MQLRLPRIATSCSECRRRKQRCNQGQPCSNCARRFPQPICEYKSVTSRRLGGLDSPITPTDDSSPFRSPIKHDEGLEFFGLEQQNLLSVGRPAYEWMDCDHLEGMTQPSHERPCSGLDTMDLIRWSGIDMLSQFPSSGKQWEALPRNLPAGLPQRPSVKLCNPNCEIHSFSRSQAPKLLQVQHAFYGHFIDPGWNHERTEEMVSWLMTLDAGARNYGRTGASLAVLPTHQNKELLRAFVKLTSGLSPGLDGNNQGMISPHIKSHVPFCVRTPLLAQVAIYTASCFFVETGTLEKTVAMAHKGLAIRMLNDLLMSAPRSTSDEAITAVVQLILDEWYWGESTSDLRAHLRGLKEMIRLRGGIRNLGMDGLLCKLVIVTASVIALSLEEHPFLSIDGGDMSLLFPLGGGEYHRQFEDVYNTPFVASLPSFLASFETLGLHPVTASIMDDVGLLISAVLELPPSPSLAELYNLSSTASWIGDRISSLPADCPPPDDCSQGPGSVNLPDCGGSSSSSSSPPSPNRGGYRNHSSPGLPSSDPAAQRYDDVGGSGTPNPTRNKPPMTTTHSALPDLVYQAIRQTALVYCRATATRRPFSAVVDDSDLARLWETVWRVPLVRWRRMLGVLGWMLAAMVAPSTTRGAPHGRLVKSLLTTWAVQMSLDDWAVACEALRGALGLQAWLLLRPLVDEASAASAGQAGVKVET